MDEKFLTIPKQPNQKLYRYCSIENLEREKTLIHNKEIFCLRMNLLNDIFDGCFYLNKSNLKNIRNNNNDLIIYIISVLYIKRFDKFADALSKNKELFQNMQNLEEVLNKAQTFCKGINLIDLYIKEESATTNTDAANLLCRCFTEVNNSLLMWAYYASSHKGFCIEYDLTTNKALEDKRLENMQRVIYTDNFPTNFIDGKSFFCKSREWQHEQEWRLIVDKFNAVKGKGENISFPYVSAIYIGNRFDNRQNQLKDLKVFAFNEGIKLYQMQIVNNQYKIYAKEIIL